MRNKFLRRWAGALLCLLLVLSLVPAARAADQKATKINGRKAVTAQNGIGSISSLFDGELTVGISTQANAQITFSHSAGIGSAYLIFNAAYTPYTVTNEDSGETLTFGENGFIHDYLDLEAAFGTLPTSVTFHFEEKVWLNEIQLFTSGTAPEYVQVWEAPEEGQIDLMLFSTHCDDDQLFFAGILPYYAAELDYEVLVVYLTTHQEKEPHRQHEMLNGLYAVGVRTYPVMGTFSDFFSRSMENAYKVFEAKNETKEELLGYVVEQLRRYKPLVAIGHDLLNGEYGHGQHMVYADLLCQALDVAPDATQYPELAEQYGTWEVSKTYLHLWPENTITMDWDQPLSSFNGMTAFEVTQQLGFPCHESQYQDFAWYLSRVKTAAAVTKYNPREFGLYRSTVGADVLKNDFFENVISHEELDRIAEEERLAAEEEARRQEEAARLEEQRKQEEEAKRLEEERKKEEEAQRQEEARQESLAAAEALQLEAQRLAAEAALKNRVLLSVLCICIALIIILTVILIYRLKRRRR